MSAFIGNWCEVSWKEAAKKVKQACVFVDDGMAECLHWNGGLLYLLDAGARNVKQFTSISVSLPNYEQHQHRT